MKRLFFLLISLYITVAAIAQNIVVEGISPNLFVIHTVVPKENFYSIGRLYNQSPKEIATFNNITMEKGLSIGQHIKIPLTEQNFAVDNKAAEGEKLVPVTRKVAKGENIFKIGTACNITAQSIRQWNLLSSDNVAVGASLVIGHLKVKATESTLAAGKNAVAPSVVVKPAPVAIPKPAVPAPLKDVPVEVAGTTPKNNGGFSAIETKKTEVPEPAKEPVKKAVAAVETKPISTPKKEVVVTKPENEPAPKPKPQQQPSMPKIEDKNIDLSNTAASTAEGAFASIFTKDLGNKSLNNKTGEAATFKSTSGWQDKRYYVLMNDVTPGTIVKLSSGSSKVVYAKVLGSIPEMKENNGLLLRVSNAAASYLGIADPRFPIAISYYQ